MDRAAARIHGHTAIRRKYELRLVFRTAVSVAAALIYFRWPKAFAILEKGAFLEELSPLHVLWLIWVWEMLMKLRPARPLLALGAQKQFGRYYNAASESVDQKEMDAFVRKSDRGAGKVFLVWTLMTVCIGLMTAVGWLGQGELFLLVVFFYLCDLICVVIWCPFRVFWMKNKCCTTCRIFNWDHLMMFIPFLFLPGFYGKSLLILSVAVFLIWEAAWRLHPERFWEGSNQELRCKNCADRICGR